MQSTRDIHSYPTPPAAACALISAVRFRRLLLSASLAAASLAPAVAQSAAPAQQATAVSPDAIKQREQELEAAREQQQGRRAAAEAEGRYRRDRPGPHQAQSATDRHRRPGARRRDPDRRRRGAAAPARRPRAADPRLARFAPLRNRRGAGGAATRRAGARRRRCWSGPKTRCNRCAPRCCSDRSCPNCAAARRNSPPISANSSRCARPSPTERDALARDRDKLKDDQTRLAALVDERQRKQSAIEKDMEAEGARAISAVQAGRQPAGPDRQDGAGPEERRQGGRNRQPAGRAGCRQRQTQSGGA